MCLVAQKCKSIGHNLSPERSQHGVLPLVADVWGLGRVPPQQPEPAPEPAQWPGGRAAARGLRGWGAREHALGVRRRLPVPTNRASLPRTRRRDTQAPTQSTLRGGEALLPSRSGAGMRGVCADGLCWCVRESGAPTTRAATRRGGRRGLCAKRCQQGVTP